MLIVITIKIDELLQTHRKSKKEQPKREKTWDCTAQLIGQQQVTVWSGGATTTELCRMAKCCRSLKPISSLTTPPVTWSWVPQLWQTVPHTSAVVGSAKLRTSPTWKLTVSAYVPNTPKSIASLRTLLIFDTYRLRYINFLCIFCAPIHLIANMAKMLLQYPQINKISSSKCSKCYSQGIISEPELVAVVCWFFSMGD